jgi:MFS family permease
MSHRTEGPRMPVPEPRPSRPLLLRDRGFRRFWAGQTVSLVGSQVTTMALPLVAALTLGAGAGGVSVIAAATYLPNVALPLLAGYWAESRRRRPVMIGADIVRALALAAVPAAYALHGLSMPLLAAVAFIVGSASVVFDVASFAYVPELVSEADLPAANQATQGSMTAAQIGGPGLAGVLVQLLGPATAVAVDVVSYLASVVGVAAGPPEPPPARFGQRGGVLEGVRGLLSNYYLRALTANAGLYNVGSQIFTINLVVWLVKDERTAVGVYGLALSAAGAGAFAGTLGALRLSRRAGFGRAYLVSLVLFTGVPLLVAALPLRADPLGFAVTVLETMAGVGLGAANVLSITLRQAVIPRGSLARSLGAYRLLIFGVIPLGSVLGGTLGDAFGSRVAVALGAAVMTLAAMPMARRRMRNLRDPSDARDSASLITYSPHSESSKSPIKHVKYSAERRCR